MLLILEVIRVVSVIWFELNLFEPKWSMQVYPCSIMYSSDGLGFGSCLIQVDHTLLWFHIDLLNHVFFNLGYGWI